MKKKLNDQTRALYEKMVSELDQINVMDEPNENLYIEAIHIIKKYLGKLKVCISGYNFSDDEEEISFYKTQKPMFNSLLIFYTELADLHISRPLGIGASMKKHFKAHSKYIKYFLGKEGFMYQYYKRGETRLDHQYFKRNIGSDADIVPNAQIPDSDFSTQGDYLFSTFIAYDKLLDYLHNLSSSGENRSDRMRSADSGDLLNWTGDQIDITELVYAIHATGLVNGGEATIKQIARAFQRVFRINLENCSRRFSDLKQRKGMSKTRFLDVMRVSLIEKIDQSDAYVPR